MTTDRQAGWRRAALGLGLAVAMMAAPPAGVGVAQATDASARERLLQREVERRAAERRFLQRQQLQQQQQNERMRSRPLPPGGSGTVVVPNR